jgi:DNA-binding NtrC family response regulator
MSKRKTIIVPRPNVNTDFIQENKMDLSELMAQIEAWIIIDAIEKCNGTIKRAAELLMINRTTLQMKLRILRQFDVDFTEEGEDRIKLSVIHKRAINQIKAQGKAV